MMLVYLLKNAGFDWNLIDFPQHVELAKKKSSFPKTRSDEPFTNLVVAATAFKQLGHALAMGSDCRP